MNLKKAIKKLNLTKFYDLDDLRRQFRECAHCYHPDKNPDKDTSEQFREIVESYEFCLSHINELYQYFSLTPQPHIDTEKVKAFVENFDDIFEDIFGFSKTGRLLGYLEPQELYLTVSEFLHGVKKRQKMVAYRKCPDCRGIGALRGSMARVCTYCFGQGIVTNRKRNIRPKPCPRCQGRGRTLTEKCPRCDGFGRLKQHHLQEFFVPVGLKPFEQYTLSSFDLTQKNDTEICIEPRPFADPIFQIENYNLVCQYHLDFSKHDQTFKIKIQTPLDTVPVTIDKEAVHGDIIRITGFGLYKDRSKKSRGDLVLVLKNKKKSLWQRLLGGFFEKKYFFIL